MDDPMPDEWITIADAARLTGRGVSTISTLADQGLLPTQQDPAAPNPRRGRRLVSRAAVLARWPEATPAGPPQLRLEVTAEEWAIIAPRLKDARHRDLAQAGLILLSDELLDLIGKVYGGAEEIFVEAAIRNYAADKQDEEVLRRVYEAQHPPTPDEERYDV